MTVSENEQETEQSSLPRADKVGYIRMLTTSFRLIVILFLLCSVLYTIAATGIGNFLWHKAAQGNLVRYNQKIVGSKLIGQAFSSEKYFHPRPSSTKYDAMHSGSANLSPSSNRITNRARQILQNLRRQGIQPRQVPVSFVTESGSALDPHIVPESAYLQVSRISRATGISKAKLDQVITELTQGKLFGLYGQKRVNVLALNLKIEKILELNTNE